LGKDHFDTPKHSDLQAKRDEYRELVGNWRAEEEGFMECRLDQGLSWVDFDFEAESCGGEGGLGCFKKLGMLEVVADDEFGMVNLEILKAFVSVHKKNRELLLVNKELIKVYGKLEEMGYQKKMIGD
jgi:hypothetical protein